MSRIGHAIRHLRITAVVAAALVAIPAASLAQDDPNAAAKADTERLNAETARINAEAARINAEAARDRARIEALGLPSFEGTTTLNTGAGAIETTMLASRALDAAAQTIRGDILAGDDDCSRAQSQGASAGSPATRQRACPIIVLAGDEAIDFGRIGALEVEMNALDTMFTHLGFGPAASSEAGGGAPAVIAAISAAAGLLRSNTTVTPVDLQALSHRALATAVAGRLGADAILPSAAIGSIPEPQASALLRKLNELFDRRLRVQQARDAIVLRDPTKPTQRHKDLTAALARFDTFAARVTTPDSNGAVPIVQAVRLESILGQGSRILRVHLDRVGGSLINRTNLLTTLGIADPVRVSGGLVASYTLTDPANGSVVKAGMITCRTTTARLRSVQRGVWSASDSGTANEDAHCVDAHASGDGTIASDGRSGPSGGTGRAVGRN